MSEKLVSVIVVNYNGKEVLEKCIKSVFSSSYFPLEVIIVDNCPSDGSADEVSRKFRVTLIKNKRNIGFVSGNNQGLGKTKGEYVLLLNNDAALHPRAIEELVKEIKKSQSQILQPKILMSNNARIINSTGILIHLAGFPVLRGCGERDIQQYDCSTDICAPHGACFLVSKIALREVGLFDEKFFAFNEDTDFGWRALLMQEKVKYVPSAIVYHEWGHSYNQSLLSNKIYLAERNRLILIMTNYQRSTMVLLLPTFLLAEISTLAYSAASGLLGSKVKGYADLVRMRGYLLERRRHIGLIRKVDDNLIIKLFTCEFKHSVFGSPNKPLNTLFSLFGRFVLHNPSRKHH